MALKQWKTLSSTNRNQTRCTAITSFRDVRFLQLNWPGSTKTIAVIFEILTDRLFNTSQ